MADISYGAKPRFELHLIGVHGLLGRATSLTRSPHDRVPHESRVILRFEAFSPNIRNLTRDCWFQIARSEVNVERQPA
jgi:hypothetical protein